MKSNSKAKRFLQEFVSAKRNNLLAFASKWDVNATHAELEQRQSELKRFWEAEWDAFRDTRKAREERYETCARWVSVSRNSVVWNANTGMVELNPACLSIRLADYCSAVMDKMARCENEECDKLFFKVREDQKYCSPQCAKPAKREAKLKWWHENRGANRKQK